MGAHGASSRHGSGRAARGLLRGGGPMPGPAKRPPTELEARILVLLADGTPRAALDVAAELGASAEGVGFALAHLGRQRRLVRAGRTRVEGGGGWGGTRWTALWTVPPAPPDAP